MAAGKLLTCSLPTIALLALFAAPVLAAGGPTYRYDAARNGASPERLKTPLHLQWVYVPKQAPQPAWREPGRVTAPPGLRLCLTGCRSAGAGILWLLGRPQDVRTRPGDGAGTMELLCRGPDSLRPDGGR